MSGWWRRNNMSDPWVSNDLPDAPHRIRPETHWLYEEIDDGWKRGDPPKPLWFSLRLSHERAAKLRDAFTEGGDEGDFAALIKVGARMARASHAALCLTLDATPATASIGTDILVPRGAFAELQKLAENPDSDIEITDAGLAIDHDREAGALKAAPEKFRLSTAKSTVDKDAATKSESNPPEGRPLDSVIIAIADDGVGIANHRFREAENKTRIAYFLDWDPAGKGLASGDELLAQSWTAGQINDELAKFPDDDEQVYRALGLIGRRDERQPLRAAASHGTHMLDTAAGYDYKTTKPADQAALASRPIIAVQLPTEVPEDRSDAWLPQSLKRALDWILVKADELSAARPGQRRLPLVVNCSFGSMAGPKDGQSDLERRITQFVETYRAGGPERLCTVVLS